ncbi:unnamed protein product [Ascophyllum nodosum]
MYGHTYSKSSKSMDQPGKVASPAHGQLNRKNEYFPALYRVTQLRTDGVHCRESDGTGPVNLKVVPNECCLGRSPWTNEYSPLFPTPTIGMKWAC